MDNYRVLGLNKEATREEIETAYARLRNRYKEDRFLEGAAGNEAARKLTELDQAYTDLVNNLSRSEANTNYGNDLGDIDNMIRNGEYDRAQAMLDNIVGREPEWHYLQSIIFYKRNWYLESKKQLELALNAEPGNEKYRTALTRLENIMASPAGETSRNYNGNNNQRREGTNDEQMGNSNDCLTCCTTMCLADCCCSMMRCCG